MLKLLKVCHPSTVTRLFSTSSCTCRCFHLAIRTDTVALHRRFSLTSTQLSNLYKIGPHQPSSRTSVCFLVPNQSDITKWRTFASKGRSKKVFGEEDHEFSDDEDEDGETWSDDDEDFVEDETSLKTWKDLSVNVPSLRIDAILSSGLGVSRKKIEDAFLEARLRLNDKVITKKSKMVKAADVIDIILKDKQKSEEAQKPDSLRVMRVKVLKIKEERTPKDRVPVKLRRWKYLEVTKT